jgi:hypothetical protein
MVWQSVDAHHSQLFDGNVSCDAHVFQRARAGPRAEARRPVRDRVFGSVGGNRRGADSFPARSAPDRREPHADVQHVPSYCNSSTRRRRRHINMKKSTSPTRLSTTGAACSAACCRARGLYGMSARSPRTRYTDGHYTAPTSRRQRPRNAQSWTCRSGS